MINLYGYECKMEDNITIKKPFCPQPIVSSITKQLKRI